MRRTGVPNLVTTQGKHHALSRVAYSDRRIGEAFLQSTLHQSPGILPIEEIDASFAPLASLGREIAAIDNLFISPSGKLTLVETKLWRNPQATREVVAQTLEYATKLTKWSYSALEESARNAAAPAPLAGGTLYEFVARAFPDQALGESEFIDEVQKSLRDARFLLLVVGDGIRENLESILEHLHRQPTMLYKFCLIEVQIYENPAVLDGRVLVPMVVANTTEIVRAVVRVETTGPAQVSVNIDEPSDAKTGGGRRTLTEELFFEELNDEQAERLFRRLLAFAHELGAIAVWRSAAVSIQLPEPNGGRQNLTLFLMSNTGETNFDWLPEQLERISIDKNIAFDYAQSVASLFPGVTPHKKYRGSLSRAITASELETKVAEFMEIVREVVRKIQGG